MIGANPEWIHLLIPKNNMSQFYIHDEEIIITNINQDDVRISTDLGTTKKNFYNQRRNSMIELWCKVSGIRELSDNKL